MEAVLRTEGLTKRFGGASVVDRLSLSVPRNAIYGFLGANGAGKTTAIKLILGLLRPNEGRVSLADPQARIGALVETPALYDHLTGAENLDITRRLLGVARAEIDRVLSVVDLGQAGRKRVGGYSLGMRQRLGIARALIGRPPILILDEPTNGLDPDGIRDMRLLLRRLAAEDVTLMVSSHLLGEVEQVATHVGLLHRGRLLVEAPLPALLGRGDELEVRAADPARAAARLRRQGCDVAAAPDETLLVRNAEPARIARLLVEDGQRLLHLATRRASLEAVYHAHIAKAA